MPKAKKIKPKDLVIHILNVGFGDNILIGFPAKKEEERTYGLVDCTNSKKTKKYLDKLYGDPASRKRLEFVCATHPHSDHIKGIRPMLKDKIYKPLEFWDSGFRHTSLTYRNILTELLKQKIKMIRVSSGMERYFGKVRVTVLSPSVVLRNKYATYGIDMNNASVVLRLEHHDENVLVIRSEQYTAKETPEEMRKAGKSVVILAGDAEFDAWAQITHEYPKLEPSISQGPLVKNMINLLACGVIKVAHHGSMHSAPLDVYEKMMPQTAIISAKQKNSTNKGRLGKMPRTLFPHELATIALEECGARILTTDGSYESEKVKGKKRDKDNAKPGTVVVVIPPAGKPRWLKLKDESKVVPDPPEKV